MPVQGPHLQYWIRNQKLPTGSASHLTSIFNNHVSRLGSNLDSFLPVQHTISNFQAREFSHYAFNPVMQHLGNNGLTQPPMAFYGTGPDLIPSASESTNWGGNPGFSAFNGPSAVSSMMNQLNPGYNITIS